MIAVIVDFISLRLSGNNILPSNTRCKELALLIQATENLVQALTPPDEDGNKVDVELALEAVEAKSLGLKYVADKIAAALVAWQILGSAINTQDYEKLPPKAKEALGEIIGYVKKRGCVAELSDSRSPDKVLAKITPETVLPAPVFCTGTTSIIGTVVRVGGKEPKVAVMLQSGKVLHCEASSDTAKLLGGRLYDVVSCRGEAEWDMHLMTMTRFKIKSVSKFTWNAPSAIFEELAATMPKTLSKWESEGFGEMFDEDDESIQSFKS